MVAHVVENSMFRLQDVHHELRLGAAALGALYCKCGLDGLLHFLGGNETFPLAGVPGNQDDHPVKQVARTECDIEVTVGKGIE